MRGSHTCAALGDFRQLSLGRDFHGESVITDAGLWHLAGLANLEELGLENTRSNRRRPDSSEGPTKSETNSARRHGDHRRRAQPALRYTSNPTAPCAPVRRGVQQSVVPERPGWGIVAPVEVTPAQVRNAVARAAPRQEPRRLRGRSAIASCAQSGCPGRGPADRSLPRPRDR